MLVKKKKLLVLIGFTVILISGCGELSNKNIEKGTNQEIADSTTNDTNVSTGTQDKTETINMMEKNEKETAPVDPLITKASGLGDTQKAIEQVRGADENKNDAGISS